jgi:hypothetical protein
MIDWQGVCLNDEMVTDIYLLKKVLPVSTFEQGTDSYEIRMNVLSPEFATTMSRFVFP